MSQGDGSDLTTTPRREVRVVTDDVAVFDTARFEHMYRVATMMAETSTIPDSLRLTKVNGSEVELPPHRVIANCFMIVNQAARWNMDPFAIAQCASIVHGKLMWEGKLVHAVIEAKLGIRLQYEFTNDTDEPTKKLGVIVSATLTGETKPRTIEGSVEDWHKGDRSPWAYPGTRGTKWKRQLRYMGAREWARAHAPGVMLGILADDEADPTPPMRDITPKPTAAALDPIPDEDEKPAITQAAPAQADQKPAPAAAVNKSDLPPDDDDGWPGPKGK